MSLSSQALCVEPTEHFSDAAAAFAAVRRSVRSIDTCHLRLTAPILAAAIGLQCNCLAPAAAAEHNRPRAALRSIAARSTSSIDARYTSTIESGATPLVYVSNINSGTVVAYATDTPAPPAAPVETIAGLAGPVGLAVDSLGNLYVAEEFANDVKVFKPGSQTAFETLAPVLGAGLYTNVAVDAHGTVFVSTSSGGIEVYARGATTASSSLTDPAILVGGCIVVDNAENIFVNYIGPTAPGASGFALGAFPGATTLGVNFFHRLNIDTNATPSPFAFTLDKNGDLVVSDTNGAVSIYRPASQTPATSFQTGSTGFSVIALTGPKNHHLFVAPQNAPTLSKYSYPSGRLEQQIPLTGLGFVGATATGIATSPASQHGVW